MMIQPYLFFNGRCAEAIDFYRGALGAEVRMSVRYGESPEAPPPGRLPPGSEDKIMHAELRIGESVVLVSDGHCSGTTDFEGFSLCLNLADPEAAQRSFEALSAGGRVTTPMGKTFFATAFGMLVDRFGVGWMVIVAA